MRLANEYLRAPLAAVAGVAIVLGGLAADGPTPSTTTLERCYDDPTSFGGVGHQSNETPVSLDVDQDGHIAGIDRRPNAATEQSLEAGQTIVFVNDQAANPSDARANRIYYGSGFVTTDESGHQVVVTAAHVVGWAALQEITVATKSGVTAKVIGGCYLYADQRRNLQPKNLDPQPEVDTDLAVLQLSTALPVPSLPLSTQPPRQGAVDMAINFQRLAHTGGLIELPVLVTRTPDNAPITGVSGLELAGVRTRKTIEEVRIADGSSGGALINLQSDTVDGITVASTTIPLYLQGPDLLREGGLDLRGHAAEYYDRPTSLYPGAVVIMPASLIRRALASTRY